MLNKIDKCFLLSLIMLTLCFTLPILVIITLIKYDLEFLFSIVFITSVFNYLIIVPVLFITQIITFIIKISTKNKYKKDWMIILSNIISILFFGFLLLCFYCAAIIL